MNNDNDLKSAKCDQIIRLASPLDTTIYRISFFSTYPRTIDPKTNAEHIMTECSYRANSITKLYGIVIDISQVASPHVSR